MSLHILHQSPIYPENELLRRIAGGDAEAFSILYQLYLDKTYGYILNIVPSAALAEDIFQDVFTRIWEQRSNLAEIEDFNAYLYTVIRNRAFDGLRRLAREHAILKELIESSPGSGEPSDEKVHYSELLQKIHRAVKQLPEQQRQVYLLSREQGLKHEEIAARLQIATTTVNKHMTRALQFLRKSLLFFL